MRSLFHRLNGALGRLTGYQLASTSFMVRQAMMLDHYRAAGDAAKRPMTSDIEARLLLLAGLLKPKRLKGGAGKIRVGGASDGGYVMIDDMADLRKAFSLGVGPNVDWDYAMAERGLDVHQFDHTVPGPPRRHARFHFHPREIGDGSTPGTESLASLMTRHGSPAAFSNLLKIDIEGSEWAVFAAADPALLAKFPQILCEFHALAHVHDEARYSMMTEALRRLRQHFEVVHVHGNNAGGRAFIKDQVFPNVLEVTFANKALYAVADEPEDFPTPLDAPNDENAPDYLLGGFRPDEVFAEAAPLWARRAARVQDAAVFEPDAYLRANPDVVASGMDAWTHWCLYGREEGRCLSLEERDFDACAYLDANLDVADSGFDPLTHWRHFGRREGRALSPAAAPTPQGKAR